MIKETQTLSTNLMGTLRNLNASELFAAGVVHDFKNVLTVIECTLSLLGRRELDPANLHSLIAETSKSLNRGKCLAQKLLSLYRGEDLAEEPICVVGFFLSLKQALATTAGPLVDIDFDVPPGLPNIHADRLCLELTLLNLVINARDAMPRGGKIYISSGLVQACPLNNQTSYIRTVIRDTGHGMDEDTLAHATDLFFTTKRSADGTGLGLWQVGRFLTESGGNFSLSSKPGEGTTAELWLPVRSKISEPDLDTFAISQI